MDEIKTDLFPESLRAAGNGQGKRRTEALQRNQTVTMKIENEYKDTMTPEEPLPEAERPKKEG